MPSPRFQHGYAYDVFVSYTHVDDAPDGGRRWVTQFTQDLKTRLQIVSGRTVEFWRDTDKLGAADRFNDTIATALGRSALLLTVLSPSYINSEPCAMERAAFLDRIRRDGRESLGDRARIVKAAKFIVPRDRYPPELAELLEHGFYEPGPPPREFHLSDRPEVQARYHLKVDDVAQELADLLKAFDTGATHPSSGVVYLAESTSDVQVHREALRRHLLQLGFDVQPTRDLRLLPGPRAREIVADTLKRARLAVHPVGGYYGFVPEGSDTSLVQMQLDLSRADARNGDLARIIWVPEGLDVKEEAQQKFLAAIRSSYAGHGFELLERPFGSLEARVLERLRNAGTHADPQHPRDSVYVICDQADRALAKQVRSFIFSRHCDVEWTPAGISDIGTSPEHHKLLRRNRGHLVIHGATLEGWLQDRLLELDDAGATGGAVQAIYLADPKRGDKDDILVRDVRLLEGYTPAPIGAVVEPFLSALGGGRGPGPTTDSRGDGGRA